MGKNPAFLFYPSDWTRDLDDLDLEIEGAWIRILCRLWWSPERGQTTKSLKEFARILRKTEKKTLKILQILIKKEVASGDLLDNQNITIISRRMIKDVKISKIRQEVGKLGGNPGLLKIKEKRKNLVNQTDNQNDQSSVSVSVSSSVSNNNIKDIYSNIISYLNQKTGKKYKNGNKKTAALIKSRLNEKFTEQDFYTVIDNKVAKWLTDPKMVEFLRPETLFGNKFESYLQDKPHPLAGKVSETTMQNIESFKNWEPPE